jgi:acid phosphatase (class A)
MNQISRFLLVLFVSLLSLSASAAYLPQGKVDVTKVLSGPPAAESAQAKADAAEIEAWQKKRTEAECARALRAEHIVLDSTFGAPDGPLSAADIKTLDPFLKDVHAEAAPIVSEGKRHWQRLRPFAALKDVQNCSEKGAVNPSYSYPSGHATLSRLYARVLGAVRPDQAKAFLARADQIAQDRVIAGVHFPSDIEAGKKLGDAIFDALMESDSFRKRVKETAKALVQNKKTGIERK